MQNPHNPAFGKVTSTALLQEKDLHLIYCTFLTEICRGLLQVQQRKCIPQRKPVAITTVGISGLKGSERSSCKYFNPS